MDDRWRQLWDFDDPAGSAARFRSAVEASGDDADRELGLTQLARALGLQQRYAEGHAVLDGLTAGTPEVAVRVALERGRLYRSSGDPDASVEPFGRAAALARSAGLEEAELDALHMLALVVPADRQLTATLAALDRARAATDPRARNWDAALLNNLGMTHADAGDFDAALPVFEQALDACRRIGDPGRIRIARWMIGWTLRNLGETDRARAIQTDLKTELDALGETDTYVDEELALLG